MTLAWTEIRKFVPAIVLGMNIFEVDAAPTIAYNVAQMQVTLFVSLAGDMPLRILFRRRLEYLLYSLFATTLVIRMEG